MSGGWLHCYGVKSAVDVILRWMGKTEDAYTTTFYFMLFGAIACGLYWPFSANSIDFTGQKEPVSGTIESVPKLAFGKAVKTDKGMKMSLGISVNHALVDGYHIGLFTQKFHQFLNQ